MTRALIALALLFCASCSNPPVMQPSTMTPPDRDASAFNGVLAAGYMALEVVKHSHSPNSRTSNPGIYGHCYLSKNGKPTGHACPNTYILFTDSIDSSSSRVWVDTDGTFSRTVPTGRKFKIEAFHGMTKSNTLEVAAPSEVSLQVEAD